MFSQSWGTFLYFMTCCAILGDWIEGKRSTRWDNSSLCTYTSMPENDDKNHTILTCPVTWTSWCWPATRPQSWTGLGPARRARTDCKPKQTYHKCFLFLSSTTPSLSLNLTLTLGSCTLSLSIKLYFFLSANLASNNNDLIRGNFPERFGTADELVEGLDNVCEGGPVSPLLLPAVQHQLVQRLRTVHRGRQSNQIKDKLLNG